MDDQLMRILDRLDHPGRPWASGERGGVLPLVAVEGVGPVAFPLLESQGQALRARATPAPFGRGTQTVVDLTVRRAGQYPPEQVQLDGLDDVLESIVDEARSELGLPPGTRASLYKLLIYGPGDFFLPHRDTEKQPGMVATLVLTLPGRWTGGELHVAHQDERAGLLWCPDRPDRLAWAAFYCDCEHELRPVSSGHRLALVYSLCLPPDEASGGWPLPDDEPEVTALQGLLEAWDCEDDLRAIILDHRYSREGLSWAGLKGRDRARANVLRRAAERADCRVALATWELWLHQPAWEGGRRRRYEDPEIHIEPDVLNGHELLEHWAWQPGEALALDRLPIEASERLPAVDPDGLEPDSFDYEATTGNEGATVERTWRRAVLTVWPRSREADIVLRGGLVAAGRYLGSTEADVDTAAALVECILSGPATDQTVEAVSRALAEATLEQSRTWARLHLAEGPLPTAALTDLAIDLGDDTALWREVGRERLADPSLGLLLVIFRTRGLRSGLHALVEGILDALAEPPLRPVAASWEAEVPLAPLDTLVFLEEDLTEPIIGRLWTVLLGSPARLPLRSVLVPLLRATRHARLRSAVVAQLQAAVAEQPRPPQDAQRAGGLGCECELCVEVEAFLADPLATTHRIPTRKDNRRHLRRELGAIGAEVRTATERRGSPFTLVLTKTQRAFDAAHGQWTRDREVLEAILDESPRTTRT